MRRRAVMALGIGQCVNWGVLYYAFAVLVVPLERELGVATWVVTGAFSLALMTSALLAPMIGRWADRGRGAMVMQVGGLAAAMLLIVWAYVPGVVTLYLVWAGLGFCMAATLYEPAFVIVGLAYDDPARRLRALGAVTLFGGLASTLFLPGTALGVATAGRRGAVVALAALLLASTAILRMFVFRDLAPRSSPRPSMPARHDATTDGTTAPRFAFVAAIFAFVSLAGAAFTTNLIPALGERGISTAQAAMLGGLIGVMQLPGRALLMNGRLAGSPTQLVALCLVLQGVGLGGIAVAPSIPLAAGATMIFALGAGMTTLVRPHLIQTLYSGGGGSLNGRIARQQQIARAAGPIAIAWLAGVVGYTTVFAVIAATFAGITLVWLRMPGWGSRTRGAYAHAGTGESPVSARAEDRARRKEAALIPSPVPGVWRTSKRR